MNAPRRSLRIIWAVNPFDDFSGSAQAGLLHVLRELRSKAEARIEPIYVLGPRQLEVPHELAAGAESKYLPAAERALRASLEKSGIDGLTEAKVIFHNGTSLKGSARALAQHAMRAGADVIVTASHGRQGLPRLFLGSFAETLVQEADLPVLVAGPCPEGRKTPEPLSRILFPSDLGAPGFKAFTSAVSFARSIGSDLSLLHVLASPAEPVVNAGVFLLGGGWLPAPEFIANAQAQAEETARAWVTSALQTGIKAEFTVTRDRTPTQGALATILEHAADPEQRYGMIAIASQSGPITSALVGSIARQVMRLAPCPVPVVKTT